MHELLNWYNYLSQSKSFKWAKFWGLILALLLAGIGYFWFQGHGFEAILILGLPVFFAASNTMENLGLAYQYATLMGIYTANRQAQTATANEGEEAQPQIAVSREAEAEGDGEDEVVASDAAKLILCQFYVFLYLLFEVRVVGEGTHQRLVGLPAQKYRLFMKRLADSGLGLVDSSQGRTIVNDAIDFAMALEMIAVAQHNRNLWEYPIAVYNDERNWRENDPNFVWSGKTRLKVSNHKKRDENDPPLLPYFPHSLKNFNI